MAAFNLTAELNLRGPSNINQVVGNIRRQLSTLTLDLNINPNTSRGVQAVTANIRTLSTALRDAQNNATALSTTLSNLVTTINNTGNAATNAGNAINRLNTQTRAAQGAARDGATAMENFGAQSALAIRRFAAFSVATGAVYAFTRALSSAYSEFVNFNKEFVRLQQVTNSTASGLSGLSQEITRLSTGLGVSSSELLTVSSTLAQAGLSATQTKTALEALAKSALAPSFDSLNETVEGSIALMRQFGLSAGDLEGALGSINAVAAKFAVESSDIITAIQRTGGVFAAASKGVSQGKDALNEFIAVFTSVRATTRESAETIATGLRTIFTRIQRGNTIQALKEYGITLTDLEGKFVGPYEAVRRLSEGLRGLDPRDLRFSEIVEELGGFRQIGKVIPLIQQFATAQQALSVAQRGSGSLASDAAKAQEALAIRVTKVREEFIALIRDIGQTQSFQKFVDISLQLASALISVASAAKDVLPAITAIAAIRAVPAIAQFAGGFGRGITRRNQGGPINKFARGGMVPGSGSGDTVPAMLTPGEFVIRKKAVKAIGIGNLHKINKYASGGRVKELLPIKPSLQSKYDTDDIEDLYSLISIDRKRANKLSKTREQYRKEASGIWDRASGIYSKSGSISAANRFIRRKVGINLPSKLLNKELDPLNTDSQRLNKIQGSLAEKEAYDRLGNLRQLPTFAGADFAVGGSSNQFVEVKNRLEAVSDADLKGKALLAHQYISNKKYLNNKIDKTPRIRISLLSSNEQDYKRRRFAYGGLVKETSIEDLKRKYPYGIDDKLWDLFDDPKVPRIPKGQFLAGFPVPLAEELFKGGEKAFTVPGRGRPRKEGSPVSKIRAGRRTKLGTFFRAAGMMTAPLGKAPPDVFEQTLRKYQNNRQLGAVANIKQKFISWGKPGGGSFGDVVGGYEDQIRSGLQSNPKLLGYFNNILKAGTLSSYLNKSSGFGGVMGHIPPLKKEIYRILGITGKNLGGFITKFAKGGSAQDTVPALLTPGEFVINKKAASRLGSSRLNRLNKADKIQGFNKGGAVGDIQSFAGGGIVQSFFVGGAVQAATQIARQLPQLATAIGQALRILPRNLPQGAGWLASNRGTRAMGLPQSAGGMARNALFDPMTLLFGSSFIGEGVSGLIGGARGEAAGSAVSGAASGASIVASLAPLLGLSTPVTAVAAGFVGLTSAISAYNKSIRDSNIAENNKKVESSSERLSQSLDKLATSSGVASGSLESIRTEIANITTAQRANVQNRVTEAQPGILSNLTEALYNIGTAFGFQPSSKAGRIDRTNLSANLLSESKTGAEQTARSFSELMKKGMTFDQVSAKLDTGAKVEIPGLRDILQERTPQISELSRSLAISQRGTEITDLEAKLADLIESRASLASFDPGREVFDIRIKDTVRAYQLAIQTANAELKRQQQELNNTQKATNAVVAKLNLFAEAMKNVEAAASRASSEFQEAQRQIDIGIGSRLGGQATIAGPSRMNENVLQNLRAYSNNEIRNVIAQFGQNLNLNPEFTRRATGAALSQRVLETQLPRILSGLTEAERQGVWGTDRETIITKELTDALGLAGIKGEDAQTVIKEVTDYLQKRTGKGEITLDELVSNSAALAKAYQTNGDAVQSVINIMQSFNGTMEAVVSRTNEYVSAIESSINAQNQATQIRAGGDIQLREALGERVSLRERNALINNEVLGMTATIGAGNRPIAGTGTTNPNEIARRLAAAEERKKQLEAQRTSSSPIKFAAELSQVTLQIRQYENALKKLASDTNRASNALSEISRLRQLRQTRQESFLDFASQANDPEYIFDLIRQAGSFGAVMSGRGTMEDIQGAREGFERRAAAGFVDEAQLDRERTQLTQQVIRILEQASGGQLTPELRQQIAADFGALGEEKDAITEYKNAIESQARATEVMGARTREGADYLYTKIEESANLWVRRVSESTNNMPQVVQGGAGPVNRRSTGGLIYANKGQLINFQPKGSDTVPAMLTPGEFVVNARATKKNLGLLKQINSSGKAGGFSRGGVVYLSEGGEIPKGLEGMISIGNGFDRLWAIDYGGEFDSTDKNTRDYALQNTERAIFDIQSGLIKIKEQALKSINKDDDFIVDNFATNIGELLNISPAFFEKINDAQFSEWRNGYNSYYRALKENLSIGISTGEGGTKERRYLLDRPEGSRKEALYTELRQANADLIAARSKIRFDGLGLAEGTPEDIKAYSEAQRAYDYIKSKVVEASQPTAPLPTQPIKQSQSTKPSNTTANNRPAPSKDKTPENSTTNKPLNRAEQTRIEKDRRKQAFLEEKERRKQAAMANNPGYAAKVGREEAKKRQEQTNATREFPGLKPEEAIKAYRQQKRERIQEKNRQMREADKKIQTERGAGIGYEARAEEIRVNRENIRKEQLLRKYGGDEQTDWSKEARELSPEDRQLLEQARTEKFQADMEASSKKTAEEIDRRAYGGLTKPEYDAKIKAEQEARQVRIAELERSRQENEKRLAELETERNARTEAELARFSDQRPMGQTPEEAKEWEDAARSGNLGFLITRKKVEENRRLDEIAKKEGYKDAADKYAKLKTQDAKKAEAFAKAEEARNKARQEASIAAGTNPGVAKAQRLQNLLDTDPAYENQRRQSLLITFIKEKINQQISDDLNDKNADGKNSAYDIATLQRIVSASEAEFYDKQRQLKDQDRDNQARFARQNLGIAVQQFAEGVDRSPIVAAGAAIGRSGAGVIRAGVGAAASTVGRAVVGGRRLGRLITGQNVTQGEEDSFGAQLIESGAAQAELGLRQIEATGAGLGSRLGLGDAYTIAEQRANQRANEIIEQEANKARGLYTTDESTITGQLLKPENLQRGASNLAQVTGEAGVDAVGLPVLKGAEAAVAQGARRAAGTVNRGIETAGSKLVDVAEAGINAAATNKPLLPQLPVQKIGKRLTDALEARRAARETRIDQAKATRRALTQAETGAKIAEANRGINVIPMEDIERDIAARVTRGYETNQRLAEMGIPPLDFSGQSLAQRARNAAENIAPENIPKTTSNFSRTRKSTDTVGEPYEMSSREDFLKKQAEIQARKQAITQSGKPSGSVSTPLDEPKSSGRITLETPENKPSVTRQEMETEALRRRMEGQTNTAQSTSKASGRTTSPLVEVSQLKSETIEAITPNSLKGSSQKKKLPSVDSVGAIIAKEFGLKQNKSSAFNQTLNNCDGIACRLAEKFGYSTNVDEIQEYLRVYTGVRARKTNSTVRKLGDGDYTTISKQQYDMLSPEQQAKYKADMARASHARKIAEDPLKTRSSGNILIREEAGDNGQFMRHVSFETMGKEYNYGVAGKEWPIVLRIPLKKSNSAVDVLSRSSGGLIYASKGTLVPYQPRGTDTVPAMLTPGEFVVNKQATQRNLPLLKAINNNSQYMSRGGKVQYFQNGGQTSASTSSGGVSSFVLDSSSFNDAMNVFNNSVGTLKSSLDSFGNSAAELTRSASTLASAFGGIGSSAGALSIAASTLQGATEGLASPISKFTSSIESISSVLQRIPTDINLNLQGSIPPISVVVDVNGGDGLQDELNSFGNEIYSKIAEAISRATNGNLRIETTTFS